MQIINLSSTIGSMLSSDYKDRFRAEYWQLSARIYSLRNALQKKGNELPNYELLYKQLAFMESYLNILLERAELEHIELVKEPVLLN